MRVYLIYNDTFLFGGLEPILIFIEKKFDCSRLEFNELYRQEISDKSELGLEMKSYYDKGYLAPDNLNHELIKKELLKREGNVLLRNYPRTKNQYQQLKTFFEKTDFVLEKIWYIEANNVLQNIRKVDKYSIQAESHDPTFSHIKEKIIKSKKINLNCLEFINRLDITEILGIESYGMDSKERYEEICEAIIKRS